MGHDGFGMMDIYRAGICLRAFSITRLRVDNDGNFDMINRRYKTGFAVRPV